MNLFKSFLKDQQGSAMVEFALVSMVLFLLLFGIVQVGLLFQTQWTLEDAARNGVRLAAMPGNRTEAQIRNTIITIVQPSIILTASNISISPTIRQPGDPVTIVINLNYKTPVSFGVLPSSYNLTARAVMMQE